MDEGLRLTDLVAARMCHDLSGLLGSLLGMVELLAEEVGETEAVSISTDTANALILRLKLLRAAWAGSRNRWTWRAWPPWRTGCPGAASRSTFPACPRQRSSRRRWAVWC